MKTNGFPAASAPECESQVSFLGPLAESGHKRREIVSTTSAFKGAPCSTAASIVSRIDNENVQAWIAQEIAKFEAGK